MHFHGTSNITCSTVVFIIDVCRFHNQSRLITMLWLSVRSSWQLNKITKMDETNIQPFWPKKCGHKELLYGLAAKMWILTKTPHGYIRLLNIRATHGHIRLHIRRSGKTRKQDADYPASSGFSKPDATLRRVTVSVAFGPEKPRPRRVNADMNPF